MIDLTPLLQAIIVLAATVITVYVIPYIRNKNCNEKLERMKTWARIGVKAAEQLFTASGQGNMKKQHVKNFLEQHGFTVEYSEIEAFIESAVNDMNAEKNFIIGEEI